MLADELTSRARPISAARADRRESRRRRRHSLAARARGGAEILPSPPIVREAMSELNRIGGNVNRLTRLANTTGDMPALTELRAIRSVLEAAVRYALDL